MEDDRIIFEYQKFEPGEKFSVVEVKSNYIIFITKGRTENYSSGDIVFFPSTFSFELNFVSSGEIVSISFENSREIIGDVNRLLTVQGDNYIDDEALGYLKIKYPLNVFIMLLITYIKDGIMTDSLSRVKLSELFVILKRYYNEGDIRELFKPILANSSEFKLLVYQKFKYTYNVDELARACNMGRRSFEDQFAKNFTGYTPYAWIQKQKSKKILRRMAVPGIKIIDIINEFNFYDASHFNKFCRKAFGKKPEDIMKHL